LSAIISSNVTSNFSNVISFSPNHLLTWSTPRTAKIWAFFGIAEFFTYRNARITIQVNSFISMQQNQDRDTAAAEAKRRKWHLEMKRKRGSGAGKCTIIFR
jgi:hypothetical protein